MAKLSAQFASISPGMDLDTSTDGLVSTMKAFGIEVEDVERKIMDNINRIGNTAATSNDEIVDMLTRSSAAMAVANNTLEETIALETAAVEITRSAESTGTAFKTLSMRIRGYDEETEELSEDLENISGEIADLTKTTSTPGGISLFTDESKTEYKSTYQILKEISEIYDELTDKQQAELLEKLAGKRGGQVVAGLLTNFEAADKALKEMEQAAGSADAEMSIIEESIEYKVNALKQTWVGVAQDLLKRDDFGKLVDGLTKLSEAIGFVVEKAGLLGTISLGAGLFAVIKNVGINMLVAC
jgi:TP901 family phage tail tape measure protein